MQLLLSADQKYEIYMNNLIIEEKVLKMFKIFLRIISLFPLIQLIAGFSNNFSSILKSENLTILILPLFWFLLFAVFLSNKIDKFSISLIIDDFKNRKCSEEITIDRMKIVGAYVTNKKTKNFYIVQDEYGENHQVQIRNNNNLLDIGNPCLVLSYKYDPVTVIEDKLYY